MPRSRGIAELRKWRVGPEFDLLNGFLADLKIRLPRGVRINLFHQPRLESGFPDVVLVAWSPRIAQNWPDARKLVTPFDLRILHFLCGAGSIDAASVSDLFGQQATRSLQRLQDAQTIKLARGQAKARSVDDIFAVKRIVALEAKMHDWQSAIDQAVLNTWFSNESWILMPERITRRVASECAAYDSVRCVSPADVLHDFRGKAEIARPVSYASWLFNEWTWRLLGSA